jgi:hypothetical protein
MPRRATARLPIPASSTAGTAGRSISPECPHAGFERRSNARYNVSGPAGALAVSGRGSAVPVFFLAWRLQPSQQLLCFGVWAGRSVNCSPWDVLEKHTLRAVHCMFCMFLQICKRVDMHAVWAAAPPCG